MILRPLIFLHDENDGIAPNPYEENVEAQEIAARYCESVGFPRPQPTPYIETDTAWMRRIGIYYDRAENRPDDPDVQEVWAAFRNEIEVQFDLLPLTVVPSGGIVGSADYEYRSSREMIQDIIHNHRLFVFTGGSPNALMPPELNFKFRAIHDFFGHSAHGYAFGPRGELNAWVEHSKMFSPVARRALTTETIGQLCALLYGPKSHRTVERHEFPDQKVFILPEEFQTVPVLEEAYENYPGFYPSTRAVSVNKGVKLVEPKESSHLIKTRGGESVRQGVLFDIEKPKLPRKLKQVTWCMRDSHLNRLRYYFEKGIGGMHWYDTTYPSIVEFFSGDVDRANLFVYLLAATSPLTNIRENIQRALHALQVGEQFGATATVFNEHIPFEAHRLNVLRAFRGEPLSGPKVTNFAKNLFGPEFRDKSGQVAFPDAAEAVTVDRWVMRAVQGICNPTDKSIKDDAPTEPQYRCIENAIKKLAADRGVQARQYQAAIWVGIKIECGDMNDTTNPFDVELRSVADKISSQQRFDFDFDPEYNSFEKGLEAVVFYEGRRGKNPPEPLLQLEEDILDPGEHGEYILENVNG